MVQRKLNKRVFFGWYIQMSMIQLHSVKSRVVRDKRVKHYFALSKILHFNLNVILQLHDC